MHILEESFEVFIIAWIFYFVLSFISPYVKKMLVKNKKTMPFVGSLFGVIPQCSVSILASDLYIKNYITIGTLIAIYLSCSDEAISILLASDQKIMVIYLILSKIIIGMVFGYLFDFIIKETILDSVIEEEKESGWHLHFLHPLKDSFEIFLYVLVINILFHGLFHIVYTNQIESFLATNYYIQPLLTTLIGLIPNCVSTIIVTNMFIGSTISFGALLSGLLVNSGLGLIYLFKSKKSGKRKLLILFSLIIIALICGEIISFIEALI